MMVSGGVIINSDGSRTGTGMAVAVYDALIAAPAMSACLAGAESSAQVGIKGATADFAIALAGAIVPYITTNASLSGNATVTSQSLGLMSTPLSAGAPIEAPLVPVSIPISGSIS